MLQLVDVVKDNLLKENMQLEVMMEYSQMVSFVWHGQQKNMVKSGWGIFRQGWIIHSIRTAFSARMTIHLCSIRQIFPFVLS